MSRCIICKRRVWPWTRYGFWIRTDGSEAKWHFDCHRTWRKP